MRVRFKRSPPTLSSAPVRTRARSCRCDSHQGGQADIALGEWPPAADFRSGKDNPQDASSCREGETFHKHLTHQPPASRAERAPYSKLTFARETARDHQI